MAAWPEGSGGGRAGRPTAEGWRRTAALRRRLAGIGAVVVALALFGTAGLIQSQRQAALDEARTGAENLALVLAEQTARSVEAVDAVLRDLTETLVPPGATAGSVRAALAAPALLPWLDRRAASLPLIEALFVDDPAGQVLAASPACPPPGRRRPRTTSPPRPTARFSSAGCRPTRPCRSRATGRCWSGAAWRWRTGA